MKILVIGKEGRLARQSPKEYLEAHELKYVPMDAPEDKIIEIGQDSEIVLIDAIGVISKNVIDNLSNVKMIHSEGVGYQGIDIEAAEDRGIYVCNCKGANAVAVAEHSIMLILALLKNALIANTAVCEGRQIEYKEQCMLTGSIKELSECTIGFIGFGDIARQTARLASAFGAKCVYFNRSKAPFELEFGATRMSLDEVLSVSDIVSINLPVTPETRNIANDDFFNKMKDGSIFLNTARGELVDSHALIRALENNKVYMAGIDCIAGEPVQADNPMINISEDLKKRIVFSPHIAGLTGNSFRRCYEMFWSNVDRIANNEKPVRIVNGL